MRRIDSQKPALRVLMIDTVPMVYDGIAMVMLNYAGSMDRTGMRIDFVVTNDVEASLRARIEGFGAKLYRIPQRNRRPLRYVLRLARLIRTNGYHVVHAHGNSCTLAIEMLAAWLGGAKVRCPHSHNTSATALRAHRLLRPLFDKLYTHGFACGEAAGKWLFGDRPITVLKNGVDTRRFRFDPQARQVYREKLGLGDRIAVGHVGAFEARKNHRFLIEAFEMAVRRDPRLALVLVGGGELENDMRELVRQKGLEGSVIFTGVSREVPGVLCAMDLMALPSLFEGLPNVLIEWQASGLPALVADTVTTEAKLTDLVTFLPLEAERWAGAMLAAPVDPARRPEASAQAVEAIAAAGYDIRDSAAALKGLYLRYLAERG